ncbi:MAG: hypothetical protein JRN62_04335 [Nitrososphaerota archaeon]|jgi:hypothetical protein|nr:hypothetical protein [Nitrososphaerota archaeon]MDG6948831.1 hypothetical protein [Nitrososphaerota archaeon]
MRVLSRKRRRRLLIGLAVVLVLLFVLSTLQYVQATEYVPGVKPGDYAVWKLTKFYDASTLRMQVMSVNGSVVVANMTLQREDGSVYSSVVPISILYGGGSFTAYDTVLAYVGAVNSTSVSVLVQSTGVVNASVTKVLSLSALADSVDSFTVTSNLIYELTGTVSVPVNGQLTFVMALSKLSVTECSGSAQTRGCTVPLGIASQSFTVPLSSGRSGSSVFQSMGNSSLSYSFGGLDLPPLLIASGLHGGDQVAPSVLESVSGRGSAYLLQSVRGLVGVSASSVISGVVTGSVSMVWDSETGILTSYSLSGAVNRGVTLVGTNAWAPEAFNLQVFSTLAIDDLFAAFFGAYLYVTWSAVFLYVWVYLFARTVDRARRLSLTGVRKYGPYTVMTIFMFLVPVFLYFLAGAL